jgi:phosphate starvation-inducible protein PhoH and related proteins
LGKSAVVLESLKLLSELCGVNDQNLRLLEELLGARILYRGNELYLESESDETRDILVRIIDEIKAHVELGQTPNPDLIRAIYSTVTDEDESKSELLRRTSLTIPGRDRAVFPRTLMQGYYLQGLAESDIVFGIGPAGTGKTYLAVAHALSEVLSRRKRKLLLTRPVVEAGESLGFLPGDLAQKINPYLRPLYDAMESLIPYETIQRMEEQRIIEIAPLAYMRGRSLNDCYVILDEAQNTTREQMKMFLTRIGEGTQAVVTGDVTQIDLPRKRQSGLLHAVEILGGIDGIRFTYFTSRDVMRNPLVQRIINAYEAEGAGADAPK